MTINAKRTILFIKNYLFLLEGGLVKIRIAELRKEKKLSQADLAEIVGVTRQTITSIETGKYIASLPLAYKIAKYFGLKIEDVFIFEEEE